MQTLICVKMINLVKICCSYRVLCSGQVSIQRCILVVRQHKSKYKESVDAFCEEAIVRRELADNFCFYNPKYDSIDGAYDWAKKTLKEHR